MAKTSFSKKDKKEDVVEEDQSARSPSTAVTTREETAPAMVPETGASPYSDDYEASDIVVPRINVAQKVGELGDIFEPGQVIYNKEIVLPTPFRWLVVGVLPKQFSEKVPGGEMGRLLNTRQEVLEAGGVFTKREADSTGKPHFQDMVTADILIEKPEDVEDENGLFSYEADGKFYAPARYTMKGTSYFGVARKLFSARTMGALKAGWSACVWSFETEVQTFGNNKVFVPIVKNLGPTPAALRALADDFAGRE